MKYFTLIFISIILISCSFDKKTGIWKDASNIPIENQTVSSIEENGTKSRYENVFSKNKLFNEEKKIFNNSFLKIEEPIEISNWLEKFGNETNNFSNFAYTGNTTLITKSRKLGNLSDKKNIIFINNNLISYDKKGKIFIYSISLRKKIFEFDFYKKNFKKFNKEINLIVNNGILYAADNLGYIYSINLNSQSLVWAKNYGIPFRSNMKLVAGQILIANQDNVIYSIDLKSGNKNWEFATSPTFLKSDFMNNFVIAEKNSFLFLNVSGELYSVNYINQSINWILNFKSISLEADSNLFFSKPLVAKNGNLIVSTEKSIISYNVSNSDKNWAFSSDTILKPALTNNYVYILSSSGLLICLENKTGNVLWSKNIYKNLKQKEIKKIGSFNDLKIAGNKLNLFSKNGYLLSFNFKNGNRDYIKKISKKGISSNIFFLQKSMFLIDNNNKLLKFN